MRWIFGMGCALLTFGTAFAGPTGTLIISAQRNSGSAPVITYGFSDSPFDYNVPTNGPEGKTYCYIGEESDVCPQITAFVQGLASGKYHYSMDLKSCDLEKDSWNRSAIAAEYTLRSDYGDVIEVHRDIAPCWPASN